ncbi:hypothetical protein AB0M48_05715 [Lentzea sp. NPDC051208]|uniref:hypothetical protein n=1 Tax=Lentzea sp. NPDC051208 TaxID=3154642 RepID=UPI0034145A73
MSKHRSPETVLAVEHHRALQSWLNDSGEDALRRFKAAHDPDFTLVDVEGARRDLSQLEDLLDGVGGSMPGLVIDITEVTLLAESGDLKLVRWTETHQGVGEPRIRIATAALRNDRWLSVHETFTQA